MIFWFRFVRGGKKTDTGLAFRGFAGIKERDLRKIKPRPAEFPIAPAKYRARNFVCF